MSDLDSVIRSFHLQDDLNPLFWKNEKLNPKIRKILLKVADNFIRSWDLKKEIEIKDIRFTGSLAAFNWSKFSDVDLHIVVDYKDVNDDEDLVQKFFSLMKSKWNDNHDVKIGPYEIEVYVENDGEKHMATGLYSVKDDTWIKEPSKEDVTFDEDDIASKTKYFFDMFPLLLKKFKQGKYSEVVKTIEQMKEKIRHMRQSGLENGGQFSTENLVFKVLRRTNFLEKLNQLLKKSVDKQLLEKNKKQDGNHVR